MRINRLLLLVLYTALSFASSVGIDPTKRKGAGPLFQAARNGYWGYIDQTGKVVVEPRFEAARDFFHGLAAVRSNGKWGYINEKGAFVIPARFDNARDFLEDLAPVRVDRAWGYIDTSGHTAIAPRFQAAAEFHEGRARVYVWSRIDCGAEYTNRSLPANLVRWLLRLPDEFQPYDTRCVIQDRRVGFIDKAGKYVIALRPSRISDFSEGFATVCDGKDLDWKCGFMDRNGRIVISQQFYGVEPFSEGLALVTITQRLVGNQLLQTRGFIDKTGRVVIPGPYKWARSFSEGLAAVALQDRS